ncbi:hypothetical protein VNO77_18911 [Canavalia gladiata]|uniref:Uncharacterized protein n=1 Tax=Canavalia gladiata TaxID=3824 RepID=A0AAN9LME9_CANGL
MHEGEVWTLLLKGYLLLELDEASGGRCLIVDQFLKLLKPQRLSKPGHKTKIGIEAPGRSISLDSFHSWHHSLIKGRLTFAEDSDLIFGQGRGNSANFQSEASECSPILAINGGCYVNSKHRKDSFLTQLKAQIRATLI